MNMQLSVDHDRQAEIDSAKAKQAEYICNHGLGLDSIGIEGNKGSVAELTVLENGMIVDCNKAACGLLGCEHDKLKWQPVARVLPQLANWPLMLDEKINPYLRFLSIAGHRYEVMGMNGTSFACEMFFNMIEEFEECCLRITMRPVRQEATLRHLRTY